MLEIEYCIRYWKATLAHNQFLMEISARVIVEDTIKHLEKLEAINKAKEAESGG